MWHEMQEVAQEKSQATEVKSLLVSEDTAPTPWPETSGPGLTSRVLSTHA